MGIGWQEVLIVMILALVVFGPKRLPEIGKSLGRSVREFKDGVSTTAVEAAPVAESVPVRTDDAPADER